jgi:transposase
MEIAYFQIVRALSVYTKQRTMLKKRLHGESVLGNPSKYLVRSIKQSLRHLQKEMKSLEEKFIKIY